jgi:hypothetical protein
MAFHHGELDSDTAERMLGNRVAPDDAPPDYREVARLLQAANTEAQPHDVKDDAIVGAMVDAIVSPQPETKRKNMLTRMVAAKALAAGAVVALTATGAAAATGKLPDEAQHGLAQAAQHVGINLPDAANHHAREHTADLGPKTPPTTPAADNASQPGDDPADGGSSTSTPTAATDQRDPSGTEAGGNSSDNHGAVVSQTAQNADPAGGKGEEVSPVARDNNGAQVRSTHDNPSATTPTPPTTPKPAPQPPNGSENGATHSDGRSTVGSENGQGRP